MPPSLDIMHWGPGSLRISSGLLHLCNLFNGVTQIHNPKEPEIRVYVDACLTGMGVIHMCYRWALNIVHFEKLNVLVVFNMRGNFLDE